MGDFWQTDFTGTRKVSHEGKTNNFCSLGRCQSLKSHVSFMCPSLVVLRAPGSCYLYVCRLFIHFIKLLKANKGLLKDMETAP